MKKDLPKSLQNLINIVQEQFADEPDMVQEFINCFTNTLDTTVKKMEDGTTHVITGDIPAMWLRDSVAQLRPYLIAAAEDEEESVRLRRFPRKCPADEEDGRSWKYHEHDAWYGRHGNGQDERS